MTISVLTPAGKGLQVKTATVSRTDTTATHVLSLPKDSVYVSALVSGDVSDAATTAVVSIGDGSTDDQFGTADVKAGGATSPVLAGKNVGTLLTDDTKITLKYEESGTASTVGGDWTVSIMYFHKMRGE